MSTCTLLCALLLAAPQLESGQVPEPGWRPLDGVVATVNGNIVTLGDVQSGMSARRRTTPVTTVDELRELYVSELENSILFQLRVQAGQDMGIAQAEIDRRVNRILENERRSRGLLEYGQSLDRRGLTVDDARRDIESRIYRGFWESSVVGLGGGLDGRPIRDRFVRPGLLRAVYSENADLLGEPDTVQLRELVISVAALGSPEGALELGTELRQRLVDGDDFGQLVEEFGAASRETLGITQPRPANAFEDPGVRAFAESGEEGELSGILPVRREDEVRGYRILRMMQRQRGRAAPPFSTITVQQDLEQVINRRREAQLLERAQAELRSQAVIWRDRQLLAPAPRP